MVKSTFPVEKTILSKNLKNLEKPVIKPEKPACQAFAKKPGFLPTLVKNHTQKLV
jgi:hypothetical protein